MAQAGEQAPSPTGSGPDPTLFSPQEAEALHAARKSYAAAAYLNHGISVGGRYASLEAIAMAASLSATAQTQGRTTTTFTSTRVTEERSMVSLGRRR